MNIGRLIIGAVIALNLACASTLPSRSALGRAAGGTSTGTHGPEATTGEADASTELMKPSPVAEAAEGGGAFFGGESESEPAPAAPPALTSSEPSREASPGRGRKRRLEKDTSEARADVDRRRTADKAVGSPGPPATMRTAAAPAMKAGRHDDNKQYNRFVAFLEENAHLIPYPVDVAERLVIRLVDQNSKSLANCKVEVKNPRGKTLSSAVTYADGRTQFFPRDASAATDQDYVVQAKCGSVQREGQLSRAGKRETEIHFPLQRSVPKPLPVDIAIVLDTTGSMQSQINRLKKTLQAIHFQLTSLPAQPDIRFALVAYRDRGDDYVTKVFGFERDVDEFQRHIDGLDADGGGDTPEDLQAALERAMHELRWRANALRLGFIVADAIPHTDYDQDYNYREAMREGLRRGIKWTTVGAGGLPRRGEVIFRQIAQFTMAEYVFVTQGARGDSEGGVGEASHHVGTNYTTENLDQAIVRIVKRELSYMTDHPRDFDDTIVATATTGSVPRDKVLAPAVAEVLRQLADYSAIRLKPKTPVAVLPVEVADPRHSDVAEYITEQMILSASRNPGFKVLERDLSKIGQELKLQISDMFDVEKSVQVGKFVGAEVLIVAKLTAGERGASLFARLVRVETGEILSVAKVDMNRHVLNAT